VDGGPIGPGLFATAACSVLVLALYRGYGETIREDPAKAIARATLALLAFVAMLGAATGIGLIAAIGGGTAVAIIAIFAGLGLIAAGLLGGPRWLILPAMVLEVPLAVVSAADLDLRGGVGQREYRPTSVASLRPEYKLGMGQLNVDLRSLELPAGQTAVKLRVGFGEAHLQVPEGVCVATDAQVGVGAIDIPQRVGDGADVNIMEAAPKRARKTLRVTANVGVGHVLIDRKATCA
jgi:hypothetical protein